MKLHKPNMDHVHREAERARQASAGRSDRDIKHYEWKSGENVMRILPPWGARGLIAKPILTHFNIPPKDEITKCLLTWPDKFEKCPICMRIEKILKALPALDLGRQEATTHYYANVIDREDEGEGVQLVRFTPGIYNWLMLQMDNPKIGDLTDVEEGYDITITKSEKKRKGGKGSFTQYSNSFLPKPCPLHEDQEKVDEWIGQMYNIDRVYGPFDDEQIAEMAGLAGKMFNYYVRKHRDDIEDDGGDDEDVREANKYRSKDDDEDEKPKRRGKDDDEDEKPKRRTKDDDDEDEKPRNKRRDADDDEKPKDKRRPDVEKPKDTDKPKEKTRGGKADRIEDVDPKSVPECFAGLDKPEPHEDKSIGFNENLEKCLVCKEELRCLDAKMAKGK